MLHNLTILDGQGRARREAARRRNFECKINLNSRNYSRSNGSRPTAVQRAVIGWRCCAAPPASLRQRRRVRRRLNMSVINTGGGAHLTGGRRAALRTLLAICGPGRNIVSRNMSTWVGQYAPL